MQILDFLVRLSTAMSRVLVLGLSSTSSEADVVRDVAKGSIGAVPNFMRPS